MQNHFNAAFTALNEYNTARRSYNKMCEVLNDQETRQVFSAEHLQAKRAELDKAFNGSKSECRGRVRDALAAAKVEQEKASSSFDFNDTALRNALDLVDALGPNMDAKTARNVADAFKGKPMQIAAIAAAMRKAGIKSGKSPDGLNTAASNPLDIVEAAAPKAGELERLEAITDRAFTSNGSPYSLHGELMGAAMGRGLEVEPGEVDYDGGSAMFTVHGVM